MASSSVVPFFKIGPFAWNGLLVFWSPLTLFGLWIAVMCYLLLGALRRQRDEIQASAVAGEPEMALAV